MKSKDKKLIFVYNADGGIISSALDAIHKIVSPSTYHCSLCQITYGTLTEKSEWKSFRKNLGIESEFLHKDEFEKKCKKKAKKYPIVFLEEKGKLKELIKSKEIDDCKDVKDLKKLVRKKVGDFFS